jgi:hypothetical protein
MTYVTIFISITGAIFMLIVQGRKTESSRSVGPPKWDKIE